MDLSKFTLTNANLSLKQALVTLREEGAFSESVSEIRPRIQVALGKQRNDESFQTFEDAGVYYEGANLKRGKYLVNNLDKLRRYVQRFRSEEVDDVKAFNNLVDFLLNARGTYRLRDFGTHFKDELRYDGRRIRFQKQTDKGEGIERYKNSVIIKMPVAAINLAGREKLPERLPNLPNEIVEGKTLKESFPDNPIWSLWE
ncbi:MAG: hypothetical protein QNK37_08315 [Acidobacteriota bacterium]|nr:hypothetical protein [Acidobacteriota bacterium]